MAHRYFVDALPAAGACTLDGDLAHHLGRVLRLRPGETIVLGDGRGGTAPATIAAVARDEVRIDVGPAAHQQPALPRVLLGFACPKQGRTEWLFEHGTEVGVAAFQPLWTTRARPQQERPDRWRRIVRAAAGQCDRAWLPAVHEATELSAWLAGSLPAARVLASAGAPPMTAAADDVALLVGPEGGFTQDELAAIAAAGFAPRSCGPHILRSETAALVAAAMLLTR